MNRQGGQIISCPPAPSAPPTSVSTSDVTSSSITVQWGAVDCIHRNGDITGYSVRYGLQGSAEGDGTVVMASGDSSGGMDMISELTSSTTYTIEVAAVNSAGTGDYSTPRDVLTLGKHISAGDDTKYVSTLYFPPVQTPMAAVNSTTATNISLSWTSAGSVVDSYEVVWERDTSGECPDEDEGSATITDGSTSYTITGLEGDSSYTITVTATNAAGSAASEPVTGMTGEAGEGLTDMV